MRDISGLLKSRLCGKLGGELLTDPFSLGRYATDASIYQMLPHAVVVPKSQDDVSATVDFAREQGIPVLPRGGGTSQCGQTVNHAIVMDCSKYLDRIIDLDVRNRRCRVEPGVVLDRLNRHLESHGLWFPVDVSTASRATIGGMAANNSCGSRSIRYGLMRDNVLSIDALLSSGDTRTFGPLDPESVPHDLLTERLLDLGRRERAEIARRFPGLLRRVGGYNLDALVTGKSPVNLSHVLVGSEGTLAHFREIELGLSPLPRNRVLGVCHFPGFRAAMESVRHLVTLGPAAVELIDRTMIDLSREIPAFRDTVDRFVRGAPQALLLVEFAEDEPGEGIRRLRALGTLMSDLGFGFDNPPSSRGGVVEAIDPVLQNAIFEVRKAGLNIMMSMKDDRKPISFIEDCAVELRDLPEYTARLNDLFRRHGTYGTWYAHASVGCLHVRPVLNIRQDKDVRAMRAIAEACFEMVREYKGSHSGEHGDGLCRSEFHEKMFGRRMVDAFGELKRLLDPAEIFNPGRIVDAPKMDDRTLFRFPPGYRVAPLRTVLDWKGWPGEGGGFQGAVEMCNNNGACRKLSGGTMCPSYRATRDEQHLTRGRANTLRLAISGQLGSNALASGAMQETMGLCLSCKACKRECPTGVDMARMKIEVDAAHHALHGASLHARLVANLPRYAPAAARFSWLLNPLGKSRMVRTLLEPVTGMSRDRPLPTWQRDGLTPARPGGLENGKPVVLFPDTFNTWFEPENLRAGRTVLARAGYRVIHPQPEPAGRPACCGRTFLTVGMVEQARREYMRLLDTLQPYLEQGIPMVGLEPSCLLGMRDELPALTNDPRARRLAQLSYLFEEFLDREDSELPLLPLKRPALVHGHCHQKAFDLVPGLLRTLERVPGLTVRETGAGCCGMAGAFGYRRETAALSRQIASLGLLPAIRDAAPGTLIIGGGTSCRHQITLETGHPAFHAARILEMALDPSGTTTGQGTIRPGGRQPGTPA